MTTCPVHILAQCVVRRGENAAHTSVLGVDAKGMDACDVPHPCAVCRTKRQQRGKYQWLGIVKARTLATTCLAQSVVQRGENAVNTSVCAWMQYESRSYPPPPPPAPPQPNNRKSAGYTVATQDPKPLNPKPETLNPKP